MDQPGDEVHIVWQAWIKSDSTSECWAPYVGPLRLISFHDQDPMRGWEEKGINSINYGDKILLSTPFCIRCRIKKDGFPAIADGL